MKLEWWAEASSCRSVKEVPGGLCQPQMAAILVSGREENIK